MTMRPDDTELDDEIRGHLAISIRERIERGEDPESARYAALREFGNPTRARESMRAVWRSRWIERCDALRHDVRVAGRSLRQARGFAITVAMTLALGIGANTAVFSVVREVLLRPLANREADRLVYIRQSAPALDVENATFSVPELRDITSRVRTLSAFGEFSTIDLTLAGLGEPRVVNAGIVSGAYFEVMGLRPVLGRLLDKGEESPDAAGAAVLTHRFWSSALDGNPDVIGRRIRLGTRTATVVGVLERSLPYPAATDLFANLVTSPHHLGATMVTQRTHRMTELFARLAPESTLEEARTDLVAAHAEMMQRHSEAYSGSGRMALTVVPLREQLAAPARGTLLLLLAAAVGILFIACANVANLMLARSVRRESELAVRAALGASPGALRRTLFAEGLVLCGGGAALAVLIAVPLTDLLRRYAARFSVRALDATVDGTLLLFGTGLALAAAVVLAYVPRLPALQSSASAPGWMRRTVVPGLRGRLSLFAMLQVALSFVLLAGAGVLLASLAALQSANRGYASQNVLAVDVPLPLETPAAQAIQFVDELTQRVRALPGVQHVAVGNFVPWRDKTGQLPPLPLSTRPHDSLVEGGRAHARLRNVTPGFFAATGVPVLQGRDFASGDDHGTEPVVIVSESLARRLFPGAGAVGGRIWWTHEMLRDTEGRRIVGVVADLDDENVVPGPAFTVYHPYRQMPFGDRLFVHALGDPYALVPAVTEVIQHISAEQPVERAATLSDVRAEVLAPQRLNAFVFAGFAGVALLVAGVGVAGVLAFSVSARTREFGVRLALGSTRLGLLTGVLSEGALIASIGVSAGAIGAVVFGRAAASYAADIVRVPAVLPVAGAAALLMTAALVASLMPAARASRVDVMEAIKPE